MPDRVEMNSPMDTRRKKYFRGSALWGLETAASEDGFGAALCAC